VVEQPMFFSLLLIPIANAVDAIKLGADDYLTNL
jgi:hypothetical protein